MIRFVKAYPPDVQRPADDTAPMRRLTKRQADLFRTVTRALIDSQLPISSNPEAPVASHSLNHVLSVICLALTGEEP